MTEPVKRGRGRPRIHPKREPQFYKGVARPHTWISGPDQFRHEMYMPWLRAKAQANFRKEGWTLTFEEFFELWKNDWDNRGRQPENVCMTRIDKDMPWSNDNVIIVTRLDHLREQNKGRVGKKKGGRPSRPAKPIIYTKMVKK